MATALLHAVLVAAPAHAPPTAPGAPLLIVGAGVLGRSAAAQWRSAVGGKVIGVTRTKNEERDEAFKAEGIEPMIRADLESEMGSTAGSGPYSHVLFCASPKGNEDYAGEVECALRLWDSSSSDGRFVFTSSAGVYAEQAGGVVTERSDTAQTPRTAKLLAAEAKVCEAGGSVVRLSGLYLLDRGAHNFWLFMDEVKSSPDGLINLLHYDDAAGCSVAALQRAPRGEVLLASDDEPLTRRQICEAALQATRFSECTMPAFVGEEDATGKVCDPSHTRAVLQWEPTYKTFRAFMAGHAAA